jgi:hypothetical protein
LLASDAGSLVGAEKIVAPRERAAGRRKGLPAEFADRCDAVSSTKEGSQCPSREGVPPRR